MKHGTRAAVARLIGAQICVHAGMTGFRMAAPLMALREGYSAAAVGVLLALFALAQVFLALLVVPAPGHDRGYSATVIGTILGAFAIAATLIRLVLPLLAARLRESRVIAGAMLRTAVLFGVYPLVEAAWAMGALSVLLGLALGSVQPMVMSTLHQITPRNRHGEALGLRSMAINGSSVLMPLLFGSAGLVIGVGGVFWVVGGVVGLGALIAARLDPGSRTKE